MGVTCEAGNAHSSGAPDFTLQWRVHVDPFLFTDFANVRTSVLFGQRFWFCLLRYGLILRLTNVYWDEAPILLYLDYITELGSHCNFTCVCS